MAKKKAPKASSKKVGRRKSKAKPLGAGQKRAAKTMYKQLKGLAKKSGTNLDA